MFNAISNGRTDIIENLEKFGFNLNQTNENGYNPLQIAVMTSDVNLVRYFANKKLTASTESNITLLILAAMRGHKEIFDFLCNAGYDKNELEIKDSEGQTILMRCIKFDALNNLENLIKFGANLKSIDNNGDSPIHVAIKSDNYKAIIILLNHLKSNPELLSLRNKMGQAPLLYAVTENRYLIAYLLLKSGASANEKDELGNSALHYAVYNNNLAMVKLLKMYKANLKEENFAKETPILLALSKQNFKIVEYLSKKLAQIK